MWKLVLIATLMNDPSQLKMAGTDEATLQKIDSYLTQFSPMPVGVVPQLNANMLAGAAVDGANGGGGDVATSLLDYRVSNSGKTAQRFFVSPLPKNAGGVESSAFTAIKYPHNMRAEVVITFESDSAYRKHMEQYSVVYRSLFGYVTTMVVSKNVE